MRGLPPVPTTIGQLEQEWESSGRFMSNSWWVQVNLPLGYGISDLLTLLNEYTLYALPNLLNGISAGTSPTTCRLQVSGNVVTVKNPPAHGAWSGQQALNCAGGLIWRTGDGGRRGWAISYLPGLPDGFVDGSWQLSASGYANLLDAGVNFKLQLESLPSYPDQTLVLGTLHRSRAGVPLPHSIFSPYLSVEPALKVVTIRRRIPRGPSVLPF